MSVAIDEPVSSPGSKFCSISSGAALKWMSATDVALGRRSRSASGRRSAKSTQAPASTLWVHKTGNVLRPTSCPRVCKRKLPKGRLPRLLDGRSRQEGCRERLRLLPGSLGAEVRQIARLPRIARRPADGVLRPSPPQHWKHVRTTNPIGPAREHVRHGSSAHLPDQGLSCRARRRWPWSSNYASALRENGENSMDRTISPRSFAASNS